MEIIDINMKALICFRKVAECGNTTAAARELYISQPQLSRIIRDVEAWCGYELFERTSKGMILNRCGKEFYRFVQEVNAASNSLQKRLNNAYQRCSAQLAVVTNVPLYMPLLFRIFKERLPGLKFRQFSAKSNKLDSMLREDFADFAIAAPNASDLYIESSLLRREPAVIIYPEGHWLQQRDRVSLQELRGEQFVGLPIGYGARDAADLAFKRANMSVEYSIETSESSQTGRFVREGLGIAAVPYSMYREDRFFQNHLIWTEEEISGDIGISWKRGRQFSEADQVFFDCAKDFFSSLE